MYTPGPPWWDPAAKNQPPQVPPSSTDEDRRLRLMLQVKAIVDGIFMELEHMSKVWDDHKKGLADAKAAMLTAMTLIDSLDKPKADAIDPAEVLTADADLNTVTNALVAKIAAHTPQAPPAPATPTTGV